MNHQALKGQSLWHQLAPFNMENMMTVEYESLNLIVMLQQMDSNGSKYWILQI